MPNTKRHYETGDIFALTSGEGHDYQLNSVAKVIHPFHVNEVIVTWGKQYAQQEGDGRFVKLDDAPTLIEWLVSQGFVSVLPHSEWHYGWYDAVDLLD